MEVAETMTTGSGDGGFHMAIMCFIKEKPTLGEAETSVVFPGYEEGPDNNMEV